MAHVEAKQQQLQSEIPEYVQQQVQVATPSLREEFRSQLVEFQSVLRNESKTLASMTQGTARSSSSSEMSQVLDAIREVRHDQLSFNDRLDKMAIQSDKTTTMCSERRDVQRRDQLHWQDSFKVVSERQDAVSVQVEEHRVFYKRWKNRYGRSERRRPDPSKSCVMR